MRCWVKNVILPILEMNIIEVLSEEQADLPAKYDGQLVRRPIEWVSIFDKKVAVRFKAGVEIDVEK